MNGIWVDSILFGAHLPGNVGTKRDTLLLIIIVPTSSLLFHGQFDTES